MKKNKYTNKNLNKNPAPVHAPRFESVSWILGDTGGVFHEMGRKGGTSLARSYDESVKEYYAVPDSRTLKKLFIDGNADSRLVGYFNEFVHNGVLFVPNYTKKAHFCYKNGENPLITVHVIKENAVRKQEGRIKEILEEYRAGRRFVAVDMGYNCMDEFLGKRYSGSGVAYLRASASSLGRY
jgi:hypothetical protein